MTAPELLTLHGEPFQVHLVDDPQRFLHGPILRESMMSPVGLPPL